MSVNVTDDSIQVGLQEVLGATVKPFSDPQGKVWFRVEVGHEESLTELYSNKKIGALDALKAIKAMRQAIFALKNTTGNGRTTKNGSLK